MALALKNLQSTWGGKIYTKWNNIRINNIREEKVYMSIAKWMTLSITYHIQGMRGYCKF